MFLQQVRMMKLRFSSISKVLIVVVLFAGLMSCEQSDYEKVLREEYNTQVRNDSLFLGFYLGSTKEEFFSHGWKINKKGLVKQGRQNMNVSHVIKSADGSSDIEMLFYPDFDEETKIRTMPVRMLYTGWAPWNEHLFADSLAYAVMDSMMVWYGGNSFDVFTDAKTGVDVWFKVDGNRQITLGVVDEKEIKVMIKDMYHPDNDPFK